MIRTLYRKIVPKSLRKAVRMIIQCFRYVYVQIKAVLGIPLKKPLDKIRFAIYLADHCNLNCIGCNNYSPIAEPALLNPDEIEPDIKRLGELFNHECFEIWFSGGEPLLNPETSKFMKITRGNFPQAKIMLFTNGLLLLNQSDAFWRSCNDNNIIICITHYPIKLNNQAIRDKAHEFGVTITWAWTDDAEIKDNTELHAFQKEPLDIKGTGNKNWNFANCYKGNLCIALYKGHLYGCSRAMCIRHFNKKFGFNIFYPQDMIDIYKETNKDEILRKLAMPLEFCKHCDLNYENVEWRVSKQDINEWVK